MPNRPIEIDFLLGNIRQAARDVGRVTGLTHRHYKYPARFSPRFVAAAIENFSQPGDLVLDPYMGGGTTIVEAIASSRSAVGCDLNSLAVFVARVKTSVLTHRDVVSLEKWASEVVPELLYSSVPPGLEDIICETRTRNLELPRARALKKFIALALLSLDEISSKKAKNFARCAILNVSQWALNGRKQSVSVPEFRMRLTKTTIDMLNAAQDFASKIINSDSLQPAPILIHGSAETLSSHKYFRNGALADLVITSPPYPGVHVLYHRWQVDGRKETPAPYWIANCLDGQASSYYNFGRRKQEHHEDYFEASLRTLVGIRSAMRDNAPMIQMVAFSDPKTQLSKYLENMRVAGFTEVRPESKGFKRIWRGVPQRSWHAELQGKTSSAREVVLIHRAT